MKPQAILLLYLLILSGCSQSGEKAAIGRQLRDYPESRVQDIYKSFCQDYLGPGHLIPNPEHARNYLKSELALFREDLESLRHDAPERLFYFVGDRGDYVRVDLVAVLKGLICEEKLLEAFIRSANEGRKASSGEWIAKWKIIAEVIKKDFDDIPDAEKDLQRLDSLINTGNLIVHHSPEFSRAYHPHYRIIAREIFESELMPLLCN